MDIKTIYQMVSFQQNKSPRQYVDHRTKSEKKPVPKHKRRRTYIEDIQKFGKFVPGPGKYQVNPQLKQISHRKAMKVSIEEQAKKPGDRYADKLIKEKKKIPGVGKYELQVDHTKQIKSRYKMLGDRARKQAPIFKPTQFDDTQIDSIKVGPGIYNPYKAFGGDIVSFKIQEEDHLAVKEQQYPDPKKQKKKLPKSQSLPKLPSSMTYAPIPQNYQTFDRKASISQSISSSQTFTKAKRKVFEQAAGPGPKYSLISQWSPNSRGRNGKNLFKSVSTMRKPSVYH